MIFEQDKNSGEAVYCQIADWVEKQIDSGSIREGERLPSERKMCTFTGTARNTVKRAFEELERRGCAAEGKNGGFYVKNRDMTWEEKRAEKTVREAVQSLREAGLSWHETEHLFLEYIWNHIPAPEKMKIAWVDCSAEILRDTAGEIEKSCNVMVTPLLLDDVMMDSSALPAEDYDVVATTVNHYDDIRKLLEKRAGAMPAVRTEMVVLTVSRETVGRIARIEKNTRVVVVYEGEWYRYSIECYLEEFAVQGEVVYIPLEDGRSYLKRNGDRKVVILPQDYSYHDGGVRMIFEYCMDHGIPCFPFQQIIDNGSLAHLKKQIQECWMSELTEEREQEAQAYEW